MKPLIMNCETCQWFKQMLPNEDLGTCHQMPPSFQGHPQVYRDGFCSKHSARVELFLRHDSGLGWEE